MGQYHPDYHAGEVLELARPVEPAEVSHAAAFAAAYGLTRLDRRRSLWSWAWPHIRAAGRLLPHRATVAEQAARGAACG